MTDVPVLSDTKLGAFKRLFALGETRVAIIENMLIKGAPAAECTRLIHNEWKECLDVEFGTLQKMIDRYHKKEIAPKVAITLDGLMEKHGFRSTIRKKGEHLDVLEDIYQLIDTQKARINKLLQKEQNITGAGIVLTQIRSEMETLLKMLQAAGNFQIETGVMKKAMKMMKGMIGVDPQDPSKLTFDMSVEQQANLKSTALNVMSILDGDFSRLQDVTPVENNEKN